MAEKRRSAATGKPWTFDELLQATRLNARRQVVRAGLRGAGRPPERPTLADLRYQLIVERDRWTEPRPLLDDLADLQRLAEITLDGSEAVSA